jgi:uncharacterized protein (TIGR02145 family)
MKKYLFIALFILTPILSLAQASGGQIRRPNRVQQERSNKPSNNSQRTTNQPSRDNVQPKRSLPTGKVNGYDAIDLGLSVRWASCNVGASRPEEYGGLFAYGDPTGKRYTQNISDYPERINIVNTDSDMAKILWGNGWRLPTEEEFKELKEKCTWQYIETNNLQGYRVIGPNGESIFFPFAGFTIDGLNRREATEIYKVNNYGHYWSGESRGTYAYTLNLYCSYIEISHDKYVYYGQSVRPVTK